MYIYYLALSDDSFPDLRVAGSPEEAVQAFILERLEAGLISCSTFTGNNLHVVCNKERYDVSIEPSYSVEAWKKYD